MDKLTEITKIPYFCKAFTNNEWRGLGVVFAATADEAWEKAIAIYGKVDSVYDIYFSD